MTVRAVLFDWGHTLFDTAGSVDFIVDWAARNGPPGVAAPSGTEVREVWDAARRRSRSADELAKGRDKSAAVHRECWLSLWGELESRWPGLTDELYDFETTAAGWSPYVDTPEVLHELRRRAIPVVIVSDVPFDLRPILAHYGLHELIHTYVLSGEHGTIKPELELFRIALAAVGVPAEAALMVGDNHVNDGAAIDVGIRTLLLPHAETGAPRGLWSVLDLVDGG